LVSGLSSLSDISELNGDYLASAGIIGFTGEEKQEKDNYENPPKV